MGTLAMLAVSTFSRSISRFAQTSCMALRIASRRRLRRRAAWRGSSRPRAGWPRRTPRCRGASMMITGTFASIAWISGAGPARDVRAGRRRSRQTSGAPFSNARGSGAPSETDVEGQPPLDDRAGSPR
jgi:hypothetical protein